MKLFTILVIHALLNFSLAESTIFGEQTGEEVEGMSGRLFDLKMLITGEKSPVVMDNGDVNQGVFKDILLKLIENDFNEEMLNQYVEGETYLQFQNLFFKDIQAIQAPVAFGVDYMKPSGLLIIYEGEIDKAPTMKEFRFVGCFDDILHVYLNGKLVLDGSYHNWTGFTYTDEHPRVHLTGVSAKYGEWFKFKRGDKLRIVLAEVPGGRMGGGLQIQEKDMKYRKDDDGHPILPVFTLNKLSRDDRKRIEAYEVPVNVRKSPEIRVKE